MSGAPVHLTAPPAGYGDWLTELKVRIHGAQQRAALAVNRELVLLYWQIGRDIRKRQAEQGWGARVIERLSQDLRAAFPEMQGFSRANLMYMRAFAGSWPRAIVQQGCWTIAVAQSGPADETQGPRTATGLCACGHRVWLVAKCGIHIETRRLERTGRAITNFATRLPAPGSDLARESLSVLPNTSCWPPFRPNCGPACPVSSKSSRNWPAAGAAGYHVN